MKISNLESRALRRKQSDKLLTSLEASKEIGVNPATYKKLITCGEVRTSIYRKAMEWLAKDY